MSEPVWILDEVVLATHQRQLAEHGGLEGVRDPGMLSSALARPKNLYAYEAPDLASLAAAYAFGIIQNHPFVDGNKRTAWVICRTFLLLNSHDINATDVEKYLTFVGVADGKVSEGDLVIWIRAHMTASRNET